MASAMQSYLKRYSSSSAEESKRGKLKSKKRKGSQITSAAGVIIVDDDATWQKQVVEESDHEKDEEGEGPQVIEDVEVKRMHKMEAAKQHRPYMSVANDGSGWVAVSGDATEPGPSDLSPPRRRAKSPDYSPPRRRGRTPDSSPPRRRSSRSPDLSPPRKIAKSSDLSFPRRRAFSERDSEDLSPPVRRSSVKVREVDLSPRRRKPPRPPLAARSGGSRIQAEEQSQSAPPDLSPPRRKSSASVSREEPDLLSADRKHDKRDGMRKRETMTDGTRAGLTSDKGHLEELARKKQLDAKRIKDMDPSLSGRGAETVYRDKRGRRLEGLEELLRQQQGDAKPKEKPLEWGKGLAQKREAEARRAEFEEEKSKPFARSRDDPELDQSLKDRLRWGDPMAHLVKQKSSVPVLEDLGSREEMKESGFIVPQDIPNHSWLKRGGGAPANRYGIKPGRHWDGVDRSTGFEKEMFKSKNEKQAMELEAYLWSVSDM